mmetsp:Transcript_12998/g.36609  ORF Transcript_12998/g.36609 Transcript_12998/m.36609 type:complete len:383 (+) Transcript_12998:224-1372(+)
MGSMRSTEDPCGDHSWDSERALLLASGLLWTLIAKLLALDGKLELYRCHGCEGGAIVLQRRSSNLFLARRLLRRAPLVPLPSSAFWPGCLLTLRLSFSLSPLTNSVSMSLRSARPKVATCSAFTSLARILSAIERMRAWKDCVVRMCRVRWSISLIDLLEVRYSSTRAGTTGILLRMASRSSRNVRIVSENFANPSFDRRLNWCWRSGSGISSWSRSALASSQRRSRLVLAVSLSLMLLLLLLLPSSKRGKLRPNGDGAIWQRFIGDRLEPERKKSVRTAGGRMDSALDVLPADPGSEELRSLAEMRKSSEPSDLMRCELRSPSSSSSGRRLTPRVDCCCCCCGRESDSIRPKYGMSFAPWTRPLAPPGVDPCDICWKRTLE